MTSKHPLIASILAATFATSLTGCLLGGGSSSAIDPTAALNGENGQMAGGIDDTDSNENMNGGTNPPEDATTPPSQDTNNTPVAENEPAIWLAQTHIQLLNNPEARLSTSSFDDGLLFAEEKLNKQLGTTGEKMLKLTGGKDTLLKLDLSQAHGFTSPRAKVTLYDKNGTAVWEAFTSTPQSIPASFDYRPGKVVHKFAESFLLNIPGQHLATGYQLQVDVEEQAAGSNKTWSKRFALNVGAPIVLPVTMFDFKFFGGDGRSLPSEAMLELGRKIPVKQLDFQRLEVNMDQAVFLPVRDSNSSIPHIRASSFAEWQAKAQQYSTATLLPRNYRSVDHSQLMISAMLRAGAQVYIGAYHGNFNDGSTSGFKGRGGSLMTSSSTNAPFHIARAVFSHEFSHSLNLYHWHTNNFGKAYADKPYPYEGEMFGILPPTSSGNKTHNGPTWHYAPPTSANAFGQANPPFRVDSLGNKIYKRVISTSGAQDDKMPEDQVGTFSDFDRRVSQHWLENTLRVYNAETQTWSTWDQNTGSYSKPVRDGVPGVNLPRQAAPESVLSLVFAVSVANREANLVYRPVGPYQSGIRFLYNPENEADRNLAVTRKYCPASTAASGGGCDYSAKVVQGSETRFYMLPADDETNNFQRTFAVTEDNAVKHVAINVPASAGTVSEITIYKTPNVERTAGSFSVESAEVLFTRRF